MAARMPILPAACERARARASAGLDGEATELELAALRAHLDACAWCAAFVRETRAATGAIRTAPFLETPPPARAEERRPPRARSCLVAAAATAAAVAASLSLGGAVGSLRQGGGAPAPSAAGAAGPALPAPRPPVFERALLALLEGGNPRGGRTIAA